MLLVGDIREKLLTQRHNLLRQVAQIEAELLWLNPTSKAECRGKGRGRVGFSCSIACMNATGRDRGDRSGLVKLETAQYGRCEQCGQDIHQSRLEVVSAADMCLTCEQVGENQAALRK